MNAISIPHPPRPHCRLDDNKFSESSKQVLFGKGLLMVFVWFIIYVPTLRELIPDAEERENI